MDQDTWKRVQEALQGLDPPLYKGKKVDGLPGKNTNIALRAFEERVGLTPRGVTGPLADPTATMWPATREILLAITSTPRRRLGIPFPANGDARPRCSRGSLGDQAPPA